LRGIQKVYLVHLILIRVQKINLVHRHWACVNRVNSVLIHILRLTHLIHPLIHIIKTLGVLVVQLVWIVKPSVFSVLEIDQLWVYFITSLGLGHSLWVTRCRIQVRVNGLIHIRNGHIATHVVHVCIGQIDSWVHRATAHFCQLS